MSINPPALSDRAHPAYFWLGSAAVTLGVAFHLPMFVEARTMNFHLAGMPVDWRMLVGMALIGGGTAAGWYGLLPEATRRELPRALPPELAARPEAAKADGKLRWAHWQLMLV